MFESQAAVYNGENGQPNRSAMGKPHSEGICLRRRPNIKTTLGQYLVFVGYVITCPVPGK